VEPFASTMRPHFEAGSVAATPDRDRGRPALRRRRRRGRHLTGQRSHLHPRQIQPNDPPGV